MAESVKIWEKWKNKEYSGLKSYSLMKQPEFLQEICRCAFLETMIKRIGRFTQERNFKRVIDLGCATGEWSYKYRYFCEKVTGVDINSSFVAQAEKNKIVHCGHESISFVESNLLEFDDYSDVDFVCSGAVLMYINDSEINALMDKIYSRTSEDAWFYIRVSIKAAFHKRADNDGGFYRTRRFYEDLFFKHGFKIVDVCSTSHIIFHEIARELSGFLRIPVVENVFFKTTAFLIILKQIFFGGNDYINFILKKDTPHK